MRMARCNLAPRTTVRGPGKVTAAIVIEMVLQQLASGLGSDALALRQALMLKLPDSVVAAAAAAAAAEGGDSAQLAGSDAEPQQQPHPKHLPGVLTAADKPLEPLFCMPLSPLPLEQYTLPFMWQALQQRCGYSSRQAAVRAFNRQHALRKRGLALVPTRCGLLPVSAGTALGMHHACACIGQHSAPCALLRMLAREMCSAVCCVLRAFAGSPSSTVGPWQA